MTVPIVQVVRYIANSYCRLRHSKAKVVAKVACVNWAF